MEYAGLLIALLVLLALNAFFVLAEFAIVKVRPSRVAEMAADGDPRAVILVGIKKRLDNYLSVCQVGITLASVALGMVGERLAVNVLGDGEHSSARYALAIGISYVAVAGSHIVLGELVPKSIAIRISDRASLWSARPLRLFDRMFFPALWLLNRLANGILRLFGFSGASEMEDHSEEELRIILDQSQEHGLMSFRRLVYLENVFDFGELAVRDAMRGRPVIRMLDARRPWAENLNLIRTTRFTRYPVVDGNPDRPLGFVHLKDLVMRAETGAPDLRALVRPLPVVTESTPLEVLLADMQRRRIHAAAVHDAEGRWSGFITLEDVIEEIVGTIRDEFEDEEPFRLADALTPERVHLTIEADSPMAAAGAST